jgi:hypothetical protein
MRGNPVRAVEMPSCRYLITSRQGDDRGAKIDSPAGGPEIDFFEFRRLRLCKKLQLSPVTLAYFDNQPMSEFHRREFPPNFGSPFRNLAAGHRRNSGAAWNCAHNEIEHKIHYRT